MIKPTTFAALSLALAAVSCDRPDKPAAKAAPETSVKPAAGASQAAAATSPAPAPQQPVINMEKFPEAVDLNGFGSDDPVERADQPSRGVISFGPDEFDRSNGAHWETYAWTKFKAKRWGRYQVRLTYTLNRPALGMQFRLGDLVVKKSLLSAPQPKKAYLGIAYIPQPGDVAMSLLTPPTDGTGFAIQELALIPAPEGETVVQAGDGSITLLAKNATTWSENMRYEPKPEKNCLGFWTEPEDFAEWEFQVAKPGRYKVSITQGCGNGNQGSEVEVKQGGQALKFTTEDTGGFQNWREVQLGEIEIKTPGKQRLTVDPVNKTKAAVLDVQKVVLTPVG
jgi:hypothetical protein